MEDAARQSPVEQPLVEQQELKTDISKLLLATLTTLIAIGLATILHGRKPHSRNENMHAAEEHSAEEQAAEEHAVEDVAEELNELQERPAAAALQREREARMALRAASVAADGGQACHGGSACDGSAAHAHALTVETEPPGTPVQRQQQQQARPATASPSIGSPVTEAPGQLLALPNEILLDVGRHSLVVDLPAALSLRQTCRRMRACLEQLRGEAETWRMRWEAEVTRGHAISNEGRTLTSRCGEEHPWAAANLLPTVGGSCWRIHVDQANGEDGGIFVGVCDAQGLNAWGMELTEGTLFRMARNESGRPVVRVNPSGWPNGHGKQVMIGERGRRPGLQRKATGAVVEVQLDHEEGSLRFRINDGPPLHALSGFPPAAPMRPWASLYLSVDDRVTLEPVRPFY